MHAIVVARTGDASVLEWVEKPDPVPGPGQITIDVTLSGVNFADVMRRRGGYRGGPPPFTPGLDCAGTVRAVGAGVEGLRPGQRVAAFPDDGGYAEIAVARPVLTYALPDAVPDEAGASLTMLVTAYNLLATAAHVQPGESVVIHSAAGGVGTIALQMARALGAGTIIAVAGGAEKGEIAHGLGADVTIDHSRDDVPERVGAATHGRGADVVLDAVGGATFDATLPLLAEFGRYCIYGQASGEPGTVKTNVLHTGNRAVIGYSTGGYRAARPEKLRPGVEGAFALVAADKVRIIEGARFALRDAAAAHRHVESRASHGKVLLSVP
ncbi:MAG TPA: zinc-binding dehydrogenase [Candidatus Elarobacter sp.]|jgi:NADPH2:quinone reductase|nr:zinc-binding dehydrogenase [Candidatus Elarobacter sp.]